MKPSQFPAPGHNSRAADIERTADELCNAEEMRNALLVRENKDATERQAILNYALVNPKVTDAQSG